MPRLIARLLASPRGPAVFIAMGLLLALPSLRVGLLHDDLLLHNSLARGPFDQPVSALALYDFTTADPAMTGRIVEAGYMPWFTSPALSLRFFRPLSSALFALDVHLFGGSALPAHLHSLLWFGLLCTFVALLFRRLLAPETATLATAIFAFAGCHVMTTSWLSARHTLVGATFGAIALWAHVSWRQGGRAWHGVVAPLALVVGLFASEVTLGAAAGVVSYELLAGSYPMRRRLVAAAPSAAVAVVHVVAYAAMGFGVRHSGSYISPFSMPVAYLEAMVARLPALLGELYGAFPVVLWGGAEPLRPFLVAWGILWTGLAVWLLRGRSGPHIRWLAVWSVIALVPTVGSVLGGRLLPIASIGAAGVVATVLTPPWPKGLARAAVVVFALLHLGLAPFVRVTLPFPLREAGAAEERLARDADLGACGDGARAYLLTGDDPALSLYAFAALQHYTPERVAGFEVIRVLSMAPHDQELEQTPDGALELRVVAPVRVANAFERVYRDTPLEAGAAFVAGELTARVLEVSDEGFPNRVRFEVAGGLDRVCLLRWDGARLVAQPVPNPGVTLAVPRHVGPSGI